MQTELAERLVAVYPKVRGHNPFLSLVAEGLSSHGATVVDWRKIPVDAGPDPVLLLNWFESRAAARPEAARSRAAKRRETSRLAEYFGQLDELAQLKDRGFRLVWIAHNRRPHSLEVQDSHDFEERTERFWRLLDGVVHLTTASSHDPSFAHLDHLPYAVIPHPHYELVDPVKHGESAGSISRVAFVGGFSPRKGALPTIEYLLSETDLEVVVTGEVPDRAVLRGLRRLRGRLEVLRGPVADEDLYALFNGRTAAVLTQPGQLNSGVLFLALSRGGPVVAPVSATNLELAREFGPSWVRLYDEVVGRQRIVDALADPVGRTPPPMMRRSSFECGREWSRFLGWF